jgi:hypothetical protein
VPEIAKSMRIEPVVRQQFNQRQASSIGEDDYRTLVFRVDLRQQLAAPAAGREYTRV